MLSIGAFNALLKTLEEPPSYVIFILATTEVHKIPITILSRCQRYDFKRISIDTIAGRLKELTTIEKVSVEDRALRYVAKTADGSMRDALSLLDQCIAFHYGKELTYDMALDVLGAVDTEVFSDLLRLILKDDIIGCIQLLETIVMQGRELTQFVTDFTWYLRNLMLIKSSGDDSVEDVLDVSTEHKKRLVEEASMLELSTIFRYIGIFSELAGRLRYASQKRIMVEMTLIRLCRPQMDSDSEAVLERMRAVEKKIEQGIPVNAAVIANSHAGAAPAAAKAELPAAIPDDVRKIVREWPVVTGMTGYLIKPILESAKLSLGADGQLMILVDDKVKLNTMNQAARKEELAGILENYVQTQYFL